MENIHETYFDKSKRRCARAVQTISTQYSVSGTSLLVVTAGTAARANYSRLVCASLLLCEGVDLCCMSWDSNSDRRIYVKMNRNPGTSGERLNATSRPTIIFLDAGERLCRDLALCDGSDV